MLLSISKSKSQLSKNSGLILLLDDNSEDLRLLSQILELQGFKVKKTVNSKKAIDMAKKQLPDMIFLDVNIPDMNGYPVYQHLKCQEETVNIPIIFMGTLEQITKKVKNFDIAREDCITKPFQAEEIITLVSSKLIIYPEPQQMMNYYQQLEQERIYHKKITHSLVTFNHNLQPIIFLDAMTNVANRRKFDEYLNSQWKELDKKQLPLSLLLCSFDFSPSTNNAVKDQILQEIATQIKSVVKRSTDLIARYENDKFAVILSRTDSKGAVYVGKLIREKIEAVKLDFQLNHNQSFSLNIGVATIVPSEKVTPKTLINLVEQAIIKSKKNAKI
jgi:diguanylate cyclase (GGDEF)-like protein